MKGIRLKFLFIFILTCCLVVIYCEAPRDNLFDPKNPDSSLGTLIGTVLTLITQKPIAGVTVLWKNGDRSSVTDKNGHFHLNQLVPKNGELIFRHDSYLTDSLYINWGSQKFIDHNINLNAKPSLDAADFYSIILNQYGDYTQTQTKLEAIVTDPDRDMDSVYVTNDVFAIKLYLKYDINNESYQRTFSIPELRVKSAEQLIGYNFVIHVTDRFGHHIDVGDCQIKRIIHDEIQFESPANFEVVSENPTLKWKRFNPGFNFSFMIEIFTGEFILEQIYSKSDIPSDSTQWTVEKQLSPGDYHWVIWCIDEFQNRSRSKPASFTVQQKG